MSADEDPDGDGPPAVSRPGERSTSSDGPEATAVSKPSEAFQALGNEVRMGILETMLERHDAGEPRATFSALFAASAVETSAGFAYHLEQLVGPYLRKTDDGYAFTYAGLTLARAIAAGAYTRRVDHDGIALEERCPFCDADALEARSSDNVVGVGCRDCGRTLLRLGFPPSGLEAHGDRLPEAFDRHHRHRLALMRDGVCPECSGDVVARATAPAEPVADALPDSLADHVQASFECQQCGYDLRCPITLSLLEHPAVVSFYHDHGEAIRDRPIWNVGHEWAETVLSEDPLCVRAVTELDGEALALYVDAALRVLEVQRAHG